MVLVAMACGLAGALGAIVFRLMIRFVQGAFFQGAEGISALEDEGLLAEAGDPLRVAQDLGWQWRLVIPAMGGLLVGPLIWFFAREARAMHEGRSPERAIHGEARIDEARRLIEDGIPVAPLPFGPKRKAN